MPHPPENAERIILIHPVAWVVWVAAVLSVLSLTRNPFYIALVLLWLGSFFVLVPKIEGATRTPFSPFKFILIVIVFSTLFNALSAHVGATVLFHLPKAWPLVGGPITLEALTYGLLNGLVLSGLFTAFIILNRVLSAQALVRLIPRAFYPVAVIVSIALTFIPATLRHMQQIREAQAVRGHRMKGLRDWLPLFLPLLVGGLERALQLAEAMAARGFASTTLNENLGHRLGMAFGVLLFIGGWLLDLVWGKAFWGIVLLWSGFSLLAGLLWHLGRQVPRTRYRPQPWQGRDWVILLGSFLVMGIFLCPYFDRSSIFYYPYPRLTPPDFDWYIGGATIGILTPVLVYLIEKQIQ